MDSPHSADTDVSSWEKPFGLGMLIGFMPVFVPIGALGVLSLIDQRNAVPSPALTNAIRFVGPGTVFVFLLVVAAAVGFMTRRSARWLGLGIATGCLMALALSEVLAFALGAYGAGPEG